MLNAYTAIKGKHARQESIKLAFIEQLESKGDLYSDRMTYVSRELYSLNIVIEAESFLSNEINENSRDISELFLNGDEDDLLVVDYNDEEITLTASVNITIELDVDINFVIYDSDDKTDYAVGATSETFSHSIDVELLFSLEVKELEDTFELSLYELELTKTNMHINLGSVEPRYEPDGQED